MFNLLPGQGLGFTGSKLIAFGLNPVVITIVIQSSQGGGLNWRRVDYFTKKKREILKKNITTKQKELIENEVNIIENDYSRKTNDDIELYEILQIILEVIR